MEVLVDIEDEDLLTLMLVAKKNGRSLNQGLPDVLKRAAEFERRRQPTAEKR